MIHHLRAAGVSFVLDARGTAAPAVMHWGRDLGALSEVDLHALAEATEPAVPPSSIDVPLRVSILPALRDGWTGHPVFSMNGVSATAQNRGVLRTENILESTDDVSDVTVTTRFELTPQGVLLVSRRVRNMGGACVALTVTDVALPLPDRAREVLDFSGRWTDEREPQRQHPAHGVWLRETRHGRGGHDDPFLTMVGVPGFSFAVGEVWAMHLAWSGDRRSWVERNTLGRSFLGTGERFDTITLEPGQEYAGPTVVAVWSGDGIDGLSDRLHPWIRSWSRPQTPRPLTLNTWEAVYFDQAQDRLEPLIKQAAEVGVERFVLDDGWFLGRTDDRRALGDWYVDPNAWPSGLGPLIETVTEAGMQFGLWVEPEMVSADSELARAHPDWILTAPDSPTWRFQHVLDLTNPDAATYVFERLDALLNEYAISYLKWDHNRDLLVEESRGQVLALYRLLDDLRAAHPEVEIESCASGGARIDLEILRRVDRFWVSDCNDPLQRQKIQRWTGILIPPELLGSHVGDARAHTTGRTSALSFRLVTALFLHAGIESDISALPAEDRAVLGTWARFYQQSRGLFHTGRVVHADLADEAVLVHGVVNANRTEALYSYATVELTRAALPAPLRLPGLNPALHYSVRVVDLGVPPNTIQDAPPPWLSGGTILPGIVLTDVGLAMPLLAPGEAILIAAHAIDAGISPSSQAL